MFAFLRRNPKTLKVIVTQQKEQLKLDRFSDSMLQNLRAAILILWKTSSGSLLEFDCDAYEHGGFFKKDKGLYLEVSCHHRDQSQLTGRKSARFPTHYLEKMEGKRFTIHPEDTPLQKWKHPVEVTFSRFE
jgi:hypothetical protein